MKKVAILLIFCVVIASICGAQSARPMVTNITFSPLRDNEQVKISWRISSDVSSQISELLVYKNAGSIITSSTISQLSPLVSLSATKTSFEDTLNDFKSYYYAVIARTNDGALYDVIIPTVNATNISITKEKAQSPLIAQTLPETQNAKNASPQINASIEAPLRIRPLPYLDIASNSEIPVENEGLPLVSFQSTQNYSPFFEPFILEEDRNGDNATGDDYTLFLIVSTVLEQEDWVNAQQELLKFLQINRSTQTTARANFYLGQTNYFLQNYRDSLTYFQRSEKLYPMYAKRWIEETLNRFTIQ